MNMTITEKILAESSGRQHVSPGEIVNSKVDIALTHDVLCGPAAEQFYNLGGEKVWDPDKIVVTPDHFVPAKDVKSAQLYQQMEEFVVQQGIRNYYPLGQHGICHIMLPQEGFVKPGILIVGTDSHTCTHGAIGAFSTGIGTTEMAAVFASGELWFRIPETIRFNISGKPGKHINAKDIILRIISDIGVDGALYKAMEFTGTVVNNLSMDERFILCNMAIEAGAKNGIVNPDGITTEYLDSVGISQSQYKTQTSDHDANYCDDIEVDITDLEPTVATPFLPSNGRPAREIEVKIDQAVIGSCTGGRLSDLRTAAQILKGNKVHSDVKLIIIPGSQKIFYESIREGFVEIFLQAGATVSTPTCGPCLGSHMGILGENEIAISTTNRNFKGRMGHISSQVYLASAATTAVSAIVGKISDPRDFL